MNHWVASPPSCSPSKWESSKLIRYLYVDNYLWINTIGNKNQPHTHTWTFVAYESAMDQLYSLTVSTHFEEIDSSDEFDYYILYRTAFFFIEVESWSNNYVRWNSIVTKWYSESYWLYTLPIRNNLAYDFFFLVSLHFAG